MSDRYIFVNKQTRPSVCPICRTPNSFDERGGTWVCRACDHSMSSGEAFSQAQDELKQVQDELLRTQDALRQAQSKLFQERQEVSRRKVNIIWRKKSRIVKRIGIASGILLFILFAGNKLFPLIKNAGDYFSELRATWEDKKYTPTPAPTIADARASEPIAANTSVPEPTQELTPAPIANEKDYILPYSSTRELIDNDLQDLTKDELRLARNEIYARYGRVFKDEMLQEYFNSKSWYRNLQKLPLGTEPTLTKLELSNIELIQAYEVR